MNDDNRMGAPHGIRHGKATVPFPEVEKCRDLHESGLNVRDIANKTGYKIDTVRDWVYYRTRCYA